MKSSILALAILLAGSIFFSNSAYAGTSISIASGSSGNNNVISFGNVKPSSSGSVVTASDELTITTDCAAGSNVYISATNNSTTNTNLINNAGSSNNTIATLSGTTIGTTALPLENNTWGFNTDSTAASNGNYYGLPAYANATDHAIYSGTNTTVPIYYGAKVTNSLVPGKYIGQVLYTATVNSSCLNYTVIFNKNADDATGTMNNQTIAPATSTSLTTNSFERPGYIFLGWSTDASATTPTYTDGQAVIDLTSTGDSITLYAIWGRTMQDWATNFGCATLNTNNYLTLYDSRDKNSYAVKKLADGKCWMVQNLRLFNYNLTSADSNVSSDFDLTSSQIEQSGSTGWCQTSDSSCYNKKSVYYNSSSPDNGAYYNWYTATAGTNGSDYDICPKGWRLPTGGSSGEFAALDVAWGGTGKNRTNANTYGAFTGTYTTGNNGNFTLGGYIHGSLTNSNTISIWWSNTIVSDTRIYSMYLNSSNSNVSPQGESARWAGYFIRCVSKTSNSTNWIQDFDTTTINIGETAILADKRDYSEYTVKKFSDGSVWMTSNLRLGYDKGYTLTSELTNINDSGTYYLPPAGYQGSITNSSTTTSTTTASFSSSSDSQARVQYATTSDLLAKNSSLANAQDTGYYNFYAATLGKSYYGLDGNVSGYVERDICPKGWQLPVDDSSNHRSWYYFYNTLNGGQHANLMSASGASLLYSGNYYNSSLGNVGSRGFWWSSTVHNTNNSYLLFVDSNGSVYPQNNSGKYTGFAVRCVASHDGYIQDFDKSSLSTNQVAILKDRRDGNNYAVKKLADGKVWMVQNLRLSNYNLTSADSNVSSDFDLTSSQIEQSGSTGWCQTSDSSCYNKKSVYYNSSSPDNGAYYNWYTATAGTNGSDYDICPKGWRLPTGGSSGEFAALDVAWGGTGENRTNANTYGAFTGTYATGNNGNFTLGGFINNVLYYINTGGIWWSSTLGSSDYAYRLYLYSDNSVVYPQDNYYRYYGTSVRCIAK